MTKWILLTLLAYLQLARSVSGETSVLTEFDRLFNQLHYDANYKLRIMRMDFSRTMKNLNAQLISRNGFIVSDIQQTKQRAKDAILEHGLAIGNPQDPCLVAANDEAIRRATQAARDLSVSAETVYNVVRWLPIDRFYSVARTFQNISSEFQWTVLGKLGEANAVTNLQELQADLAFQYLGSANFVIALENSINNSLRFFQTGINRNRREAFQRWDEISRNYIFNMDLLIEEAQQCF
ncbi:uncharacterized protein LOC128092442 [Culex pipiens pallens]|uniref:uncharacterized protein LOC128092442 n=1 Tax=Culex pipiens pallens TaxID=42434 RepID=UPI0022A9FFD1|nr:uncharacterized protein LOC128092442 [Culex pipiens pallens]